MRKGWVVSLLLLLLVACGGGRDKGVVGGEPGGAAPPGGPSTSAVAASARCQETAVGSPGGAVSPGAKAYRPDCKAYATEAEPRSKGMIGVFEVGSNASLFTLDFRQHADGDFPNPLKGLAWSPDGKLLAAMFHEGSGGHIAVMDVASRKEVASLTILRFFHFMEFSPDGKRIIAEGGVDVGAVTVGPPNATATNPPSTQASAPPSTQAPAPACGAQAVGSPIGDVPAGARAYRPDCGTYAAEVEPRSRGRIGVFDVGANALLSTLDFRQHPDGDFPNPLKGLAWSPDGKLLAAMFHSGSGGHIAVMNVAEGREVKFIPIDRFVRYIEFAPDGKRITADGGSWSAE